MHQEQLVLHVNKIMNFLFLEIVSLTLLTNVLSMALKNNVLSANPLSNSSTINVLNNIQAASIKFLMMARVTNVDSEKY
jgi:hypothetical protein